MFNNFLKVTLRTLYREKAYAAINICGLSLAIACCTIIGLYLRSELTYDLHHKNHKQICRVAIELVINGKEEIGSFTSQLLGPMLTEEYEEVKGFARFKQIPNINLAIRYEDTVFYWKRVMIASDNVFDVFTHRIIYGDPKTALVDPSSAAVSETFAKKYFGDENPVGKIIHDEINTYKITLVFADLPDNTHTRYDVLFSYNNEKYKDPDNIEARGGALWDFTDFTYLQMDEDYDVSQFKDISDSFFKKHMEEIGKSFGASWRSWIIPLADLHFSPQLPYDQPAGNKLYLYGFSAVAIFIMLVACINYMNLATARASKRAKEVVMRKILGSGKSRLMIQFTGESIFFSLIALILGLFMVEIALALTPLNQLMDKSLSLNIVQEPLLLVAVIIFSILLGIISGIYPAIYLSSIKSCSALVDGHKTGRKNIVLRQSLVLIQFIVSVTVIACTLLMAMQMKYISDKNLGFNKKNKVIITLRGGDMIEKFPAIKKELLQNHNVLGVSAGSHLLFNTLRGGPAVEIDGKAPEVVPGNFMTAGDEFCTVMGMEFIAGRDFSGFLNKDREASYIVNESFIKKAGLSDPIGKKVYMGERNGKERNGRIIGVVKDFHTSLKTELGPFSIRGFDDIYNDHIPVTPRENMVYYMVVNISGNEISDTLKFLEDTYLEFDAKHPIEIEFLENTIEQLYSSEQRLMKLVGVFATICIFISCLGLFGLAAFTTEQRSKEIGVRKVLGASTWDIITMLSGRIIMLVIGGAVIASLVAWYAMDEWLTGFAYRIFIINNIGVFLVSAVLAAAVAFITIALQSYKTAQADPVKALRYE